MAQSNGSRPRLQSSPSGPGAVYSPQGAPSGEKNFLSKQWRENYQGMDDQQNQLKALASTYGAPATQRLQKRGPFGTLKKPKQPVAEVPAARTYSQPGPGFEYNPGKFEEKCLYQWWGDLYEPPFMTPAWRDYYQKMKQTDSYKRDELLRTCGLPAPSYKALFDQTAPPSPEDDVFAETFFPGSPRKTAAANYAEDAGIRVDEVPAHWLKMKTDIETEMKELRSLFPHISRQTGYAEELVELQKDYEGKMRRYIPYLRRGRSDPNYAAARNAIHEYEKRVQEVKLELRCILTIDQREEAKDLINKRLEKLECALKHKTANFYHPEFNTEFDMEDMMELKKLVDRFQAQQIRAMQRQVAHIQRSFMQQKPSQPQQK